MKAVSETIVSFVTTVLLTIFFFTALFFTVEFFLCFGAAKSIPNVVQYPLMRVVVYGSSYDHNNTTVSARISLLDYDSTEIAAIERSWTGSSLSISFLSASFSGKTVWFPYSVYGNDYSTQDYKSYVRGTELFRYYSENGLCFLYNANASEKISRSLNQLCRYAIISRFRPISDFSGQKVINLAECETGESYIICSGFDGRLFIDKE